jgi:diaminopropionate ammonia-lyase
MAAYLGISATIYVPRYMDDATWNKIANEGAVVKRVDGEYDDAVQEALQISERNGMLLVMDTSWPGFEEISRWVVEGYSSMLAEVDRQIEDAGSKTPDLVLASVGVGSWAQSVVQHYKTKELRSRVASVEPIYAACLKTSMEAGKNTPVATGDTIMCGMNCGTVSTIAWHILRDGIDAAVIVSEKESHKAVLDLKDQRVNAGPCGAAPLAAVRRLKKEGSLALKGDSVVVLFSTEGYRNYPVPA